MFVYSFYEGHYIQLGSVFVFPSVSLEIEKIATLGKISMS